jgi:uncharacterized protein (DUF1499 family)
MRRRRLIYIYLVVPIAVAVIWLGIRWFASLAQPPYGLGLSNGELAACPDRPNCVSSRAEDPEQRMAPLSLEQSAEKALAEISGIIRSMPRTRIVTADDHYLHAEFRSLVFGFVDDVEFAIAEEEHVIHFRSASRLGRSDLGVNRQRMEEIARRYRAR